MNFLACFQHELNDNQVVFTEDRASHVRRIHRVERGKKYKVVCIGRGQAAGEITEVSDNQVVMHATDFTAQALQQHTDLIVGACRPQSLKKILMLAVAYAVQRVVVVASEQAEQSYLSSSLVNQSKIRDRFLLEAVEQSGQSNWPEFVVYKSFKNFCKLELSAKYSDRTILLADIAGKSSAEMQQFSTAKNPVLIIGPEAGWSIYELAEFDRYQVKKIKLAPSVLRVEQAVAAGLAYAFNL